MNIIYNNSHRTGLSFKSRKAIICHLLMLLTGNSFANVVLPFGLEGCQVGAQGCQKATAVYPWHHLIYRLPSKIYQW
jgi:hypothetical protein